MKSLWIGILGLLLWSAASARSDKAQTAPGVSEESPAVMPVSVEGAEPRAGLRLRDALRQPFDDMDDGGKPYRLSVEERQRLREQLRGKPLVPPSEKP